MSRDSESFCLTFRSNAGPKQSILSMIFLIFGAVYWTPRSLWAFDGSIHMDITSRAFREVPGAYQRADIGWVNNLHYWLDVYEGGEPDQYKHSMRPAGATREVAEWAADTYIKAHVALAAAAANLNEKGEAGKHLVRALHAAQDRKHQWCSCGSSSNPGESDKACSADPQGYPDGCPNPGDGNHGLRNCNFRGLERDAWSNNFQLLTDRDPRGWQEQAALDDSKAILRDFLGLLGAAPPP